MRKSLKKALAFAGAVVMTFCMSISTFAADDIILNGGEEGGSPMIKKFEAPSARGKATDEYKYQGFASFLDLATKDYKYLTITYTGNISRFRIQGCHNAAEPDEETDPVCYWFGEVETNATNKIVSTVDGSNIPIVGDNTTIVIDLEATGLDVGYYSSGLHMHCDMMATNGNFEITNAFLSADKEEAEKTAEKNKDANNAKEGTKSGKNTNSVSKGDNSTDGDSSNGSNSSTGSGSSTTTSNNTTSAPTTGESTTPIMFGFVGIIVACVAFAVSRRFKEEN